MSCAMRKLHPKTRMFAHPGFAWVARREVLSGGFFDLDLTGNGDIWLACAFDRSQDRLYARSASSFMHEAWKEWAFPVSELVDGNLGVIESELVHLNHGPYVNRRYSERGNWMFESGLCRDQVILDDNGLYTVVGNTRFRDIMRDYFSSRQDG